MAWQIILNDGAYTFNATSRFSHRTRQEMKDSGLTDFIEDVVLIEGEMIGTGSDPAADCTAKYKALREFATRQTPIKVTLKRDGVQEYEFTPAGSIGSPKIRDISQESTGADHATHIRYQLAIYVRRPVTPGDPITLMERRVTITRKDGEVIRKQWYARAKATSFSTARAKVNSFRPQVKPLVEETIEDIDNASYAATWTWEKADKARTGLTRFAETIRVTRQAHPWIEAPVVGSNIAPDLHKGRRRAGSIQIAIDMEGTTEESVAAPPAHLADVVGSVRRDRTRENSLVPAIVDRVNETWRAHWEEYYVVALPGVAGSVTINHHGHDAPFPPENPQSAMGGS